MIARLCTRAGWLLILGFVIPPIATDAGQPPADARQLILVVGQEGLPEYGEAFQAAAGTWRTAAESAAFAITVIGLDDGSDATDKDRLRKALETLPSQSTHDLWVVLIGHGTFDGRSAKFNLRGPDVSADELQAWLAGFQRPLAVINCSSCSGAFLEPLSAPDRIVVTATKSGFEHNYSRFGEYLAQSIADPAADLDKDGQTSLLEAFLTASRLTREFYKTDGRIETEHALLDDDGNAKGSRADWFRGIRPVRQSAGDESLDGYRAHQFHFVPSRAERQLPPEVRQHRDKLELDLAHLRDRKAEIVAAQSEDAYYAQLEPILLELAHLYEEAAPDEPAGPDTLSTTAANAQAPISVPPPPKPTPANQPRGARGR